MAEQFVVLNLLMRGIAQPLQVFDGEYQPASVAEANDEQTEFGDVLDGACARAAVVELRPLQRRFNFSVVVMTSCSAMMLQSSISRSRSTSASMAGRMARNRSNSGLPWRGMMHGLAII